jgi:glycosyltransferase involved in cell wall biosynthesis
MRICVVGSSKQFFSGITAHTIFLSNALAKRNEVSVILLRRLIPQFLYPGKKHIGRDDYLIQFAENVDICEGMDWNSPRSWFGAYRFLRKHKPDAIIMLWWTSAVAHMQLFLALANKRRIGARLILEMHETMDPLEESILPIRLYAKTAGRLLMQRTDAFTVHSTSAKTQVAQIYGINEGRIFVKPFGSYEDYRRDHDTASAKKELGIEEGFVILSFGSIRKYKGIPYLVKAFSLLPEPVVQNSRLVIAGEDWGDDDQLDGLIESSPYRHKITFSGCFVPDEMVPVYFSAADVVVLPYSDIFASAGSAVAQIAMAYGKPIIASDFDTMKECLQGYEGAFFVPTGDSTTISEEITNLWRRAHSGGAALYVPPSDTWAKIARQYEQIINDAASHR